MSVYEAWHSLVHILTVAYLSCCYF